jgi:UDP-N-acetylmuramoyl-tripeptide--D-alanyl-D-alanine ligase
MYTSIEELYTIYLKHRLISTDSRQIATGSLFFALKGDNFDGNKYAKTALEAGAAYAVIDDPSYVQNNTLLVNDVLGSLQQLALMHRGTFQFPVIAITGSNGKTTTKELLNAVLSQKYKVTATKGNLNNHIGVPLTLLSVTDETQIAIVEMGANHQGEIEQLCRIAEPTHGLITNIGRAHLGGFGGYEGVIKAKSELYTWLRNSDGNVFVNAGNPLLMELSAGMKRTLYGKMKDNNTCGNFRENTEQLELDWSYGNQIISIRTNLVGNYNFENVLAAICTGTFFNVPAENIKTAIQSYYPSNSRSQAIKTARNSIILDAYNANPSSMQVAIENFRKVNAQNKMVILGDMLELGDESLTEHQAVISLAEESDFDKIILVGPDFTQVAAGKFTCFSTSEQAYEWLVRQEVKDYTILIKGSRGIKMEKVLGAL